MRTHTPATTTNPLAGNSRGHKLRARRAQEQRQGSPVGSTERNAPPSGRFSIAVGGLAVAKGRCLQERILGDEMKLQGPRVDGLRKKIPETRRSDFGIHSPPLRALPLPTWRTSGPNPAKKIHLAVPRRNSRVSAQAAVREQSQGIMGGGVLAGHDEPEPSVAGPAALCSKGVHPTTLRSVLRRGTVVHRSWQTCRWRIWQRVPAPPLNTRMTPDSPVRIPEQIRPDAFSKVQAGWACDT
jgi:hypothetical protein